MVIDDKIRFKMHRVMELAQGKWYTNELKKVEFSDQIIDQQLNKHQKLLSRGGV